MNARGISAAVLSLAALTAMGLGLAASPAQAAGASPLEAELLALQTDTDTLLASTDFEVSTHDMLGYGPTLRYGFVRGAGDTSLWVKDANAGVFIASGGAVGLPSSTVKSLAGISTSFSKTSQVAALQQVEQRTGWSDGTLISIPFTQAGKWPGEAFASDAERSAAAANYISTQSPEAWVTDALALVVSQGATINNSTAGGVETYTVSVGSSGYSFDAIGGIIDRAEWDAGGTAHPYERALFALGAQVQPPAVSGGVPSTVAWPQIAPIMRIPYADSDRVALKAAAKVVALRMAKEKTRSVTRMRTLLASAVAKPKPAPTLKAITGGSSATYSTPWGAARFSVLAPKKVAGSLTVRG